MQPGPQHQGKILVGLIDRERPPLVPFELIKGQDFVQLANDEQVACSVPDMLTYERSNVPPWVVLFSMVNGGVPPHWGLASSPLDPVGPEKFNDVAVRDIQGLRTE